jgi:thioredoxin reductase (NADPH)
MITPAEVVGLNGAEHIESIDIEENGAHRKMKPIILFLLVLRQIRIIGNWGLEIEKTLLKSIILDYQTNIPGIFAIGDVNTIQVN